MPTTSGTYNFQSTENELIIRKAFERIGIPGEFVEAYKLESARVNLNLIQLEWMSKSINLWTLDFAYLSLFPGQSTYTLPIPVSNIIQASLRTFIRPLGGIAQSNTTNSYDGVGGGIVDNAFTTDTTLACTQTVINGNISYDFGAGKSQYITFIGISGNGNNLSYNLNIEFCLDGADPTNPGNWSLLYNTSPTIYSYITPIWIDTPRVVLARYYRIRETAGGTLNINKIYFTNNTNDIPINSIKRSDYEYRVNKGQVSRPVSYVIYRGNVDVTMVLWPVPSSLYQVLRYSYEQLMQDVGSFTNTVQIPARLYPALIWRLSYFLALEYKPEIAQMMLAEYEKAFSIATIEDSENNLPLSFVDLS